MTLSEPVGWAATMIPSISVTIPTNRLACHDLVIIAAEGD
jgi:hypothetical protein